ncbi:MAG TPA: P1 family peptidase, partial [Rubrivivax sp.]|nr:P1 family peptidase [Rubrivivax sp.]
MTRSAEPRNRRQDLRMSTSLLKKTLARRARDLGLRFDGTPGAHNAITDVTGVLVGHKTLIEGAGAKAIRTGVTAILPRGPASVTPVFAGWETINAAGEMTGTTWLHERGYVNGPIMITNTHSVGVVRDAAVEWIVKAGWPGKWHTPVVGETCDADLNDMNGLHVTRDHAFEALQSARPGTVEEGNVGGGTGMICYAFKGGIGTASRVVEMDIGPFTVGVLVQANYGHRRHLRIGCIPFGKELEHRYLPGFDSDVAGAANQHSPVVASKALDNTGDGSIIVVVATDAPLLPHQLRRLAKRPALALGRLGGIAEASSGDIFLAFSTANDSLSAVQRSTTFNVLMYPNDRLDA